MATLNPLTPEPAAPVRANSVPFKCQRPGCVVARMGRPDARYCSAKCRVMASKARRGIPTQIPLDLDPARTEPTPEQLAREQGEKEERKKLRAMKGSAERNQDSLAIARWAARRVAGESTANTADADRVRFWLDARGIDLGAWSGWSGSLFQTKEWRAVGWVTAKHKDAKCRPVRVWEFVE